MSEFLLFALVTGITAVGLNKCSNGAAPPASSRLHGPHTNAPITYVMAARDPFNPRYVINPYRPNERLYVGAAPEGAVLLDPAGDPYVVGP